MASSHNHSPREEKTVTKTSFKEKETKPAISENWKKLFRLEPQLHMPERATFFDKEDYRVQIGSKHVVRGAYDLLKE